MLTVESPHQPNHLIVEANSTYDISVRFRMLHSRKLKNVDKGILEGISSIEPWVRRWYIKFIAQQSRCLTDDNFFKGCYCQMVSHYECQKFMMKEFNNNSEFFKHILQECPYHMSTDWSLSHMIASYSQLRNRYISINKDRISPIVKCFITEMDMLKNNEIQKIDTETFAERYKLNRPSKPTPHPNMVSNCNAFNTFKIPR